MAMRVLVTGASGFVGSHVAARLVAAGHPIRALVRDPGKLGRALAPLDVRPNAIEARVGDVTDPRAVADAVDGCDAVIHAANQYTFDVRRRAEMLRTNTEGTEIVLGAAVEAGCDPVIHVSTMLALLPSATPEIPDDPPIGEQNGRPYADSKIAAERIARALQGRGAPVVTTYPGAVFGPHDPGPGEMVELARLFLVPTAPFRMRAALSIADVGWLAAVHEALLRPKLGPRRITASGLRLDWDEAFAAFYRVTGRPEPARLPAPGIVVAATGAAADAVQRWVPWRLPLNAEGSWNVRNWAVPTDAAARALAGEPPPIDDTLRGAIAWMAAEGHLTAAQAGTASA
jgi:dihydroflavonol-4-reductase